MLCRTKWRTNPNHWWPTSKKPPDHHKFPYFKHNMLLHKIWFQVFNQVRLDCEEHFPTRAKLSSQLSHFKNLTSIRKTIKPFLRNLVFPIDIHKAVATEIYYSTPLYINSRVSRVEFLFEIELRKYILHRKESLLLEISVMEECKKKSEAGYCVICLEELVPWSKVRRLPCSHSCFHNECISKWLKKNDSCPMCRFTA